ncbi:MAG: histidine phosphatase family protein [Dechloromonas sp.]|nr:histidine phosphatase family protein [Dechloromonas sp.]
MTVGTLYVVRHGQTGGNRNRYVGWADEPLDATGIAQARAVVRLLAARPVDAVYCSPLARAADTARPLAEARGVEARVRDELKEIDYGRYQGLLKDDQPLRLRHDHRYAAMPGGESLHDVYRRIERFCGELRRELAAGRQLVAVGHFWSNRMLVGVLLGIPFEELFKRMAYKPANGSIYELSWASDVGAWSGVTATGWIDAGGGGGGE